jgi:sarcosine oxidase
VRGPTFDPTTATREPGARRRRRGAPLPRPALPGPGGCPAHRGAEVCQYETRPTAHFVIDRHPRAANVWIAGGGSGHGFKMSPALGEHMAGCVLGTAEPEPKFSIRRLAALNGRSTQFGHGD